eukprot:gene12743-6935_t
MNSSNKQTRLKESEEIKIVFDALNDIEEKNNVKIIFAVEAGSKSFGLESQDSDFDVRGFYVHKDINWYLSIEENPNNEIIFKDDDKLDIKLTEFRKGLRLFRSTNIPILEWLETKYIYLEDDCISDLRELCANNFSRIRILLFYHSIARTNWIDYIKGKELINRKKYIYILRHLLSSEYLRVNESFSGVLPPSNFEELLKYIEIPNNCRDEINILIKRKKEKSGQWNKENRIKELDDWITKLRDLNSEYGKLHRSDDKIESIDLKLLDLIFRKSLK